MNQSNDTFPRYYVKKSGRITGPFTLLKVKAMFHSGALSGYDFFSVDKISWQSIYMLFPHLIPGTEKMPFSAGTSGFEEKSFFAGGGNLSSLAEENISGETPYADEESKNFFIRFLADAAETISLVWKYPALTAKGEKKWQRWLGCSCFLHYVTAAVMVILFARYYSKSFHYGFSLLRAWGAMTVLLLISFLSGYFLVRCGNKDDGRSKNSFPVCSVAIFWDHGIMLCALMALFHAFEKIALPGIVVLLLVEGITLCASSRLLTSVMKKTRNITSESIFLAAVPLNALLVVLMWFLVKII